MTPSQDRKPFKRWPLALAAALIVGALWGARKIQERRLYAQARKEAEAAASRAPQVKAAFVRAQRLTGALRRIGTIRPRAETNLQFGAPGRVARFDVEKGLFIKKGTLIAALDQQESKNALGAAEAEFQKAAVQYFKDRTMDKLEFERSKARFNQARLESAKTAIRAPHDGYLVEKWANVGEQVDGGTVIGKLMDKSRVFVEMDLSEDDIQHLKAGQNVRVTVDAVPDFAADGRVVSITPYLKGDSRSFNVKVDLADNPGEKLNPGMFARCTISRYEKAAALVVPAEAAAEMEEKTLKVFVVGSDNIVHARTLKKLFTDDALIEVEGLSEGERVVLHPGTDLQDGAKVEVTGTQDPNSAEGVSISTGTPAAPSK